MSEGGAGFLTILFENSDSLWIALQQTGGLSAQAFIEHLLLFIRSHSLLNDANQLAVFGVGSGGTTLLHATQGCLPSLHSETAQNTPLEALGDDSASALLTRLKEAAQTSTTIDDDDGSSLPIAWSSVLLRSLCFIHKLQTSTAANNQPPLQSRILCISSSPDDPGQYLATMNAIFAAQRSKVVIDACVLGNHHSSFMQQATHLTGGTYLKPTQPDALVQYLLTAFTVDASSREFLRLPRATGVDFRASCFCHKRPTALGFVCSVCLSIFCEKVPACTTCGTNFPKSSVATQLPAAAAAAAATPAAN